MKFAYQELSFSATNFCEYESRQCDFPTDLGHSARLATTNSEKLTPGSSEITNELIATVGIIYQQFLVLCQYYKTECRRMYVSAYCLHLKTYKSMYLLIADF